jgi:hypothetical protein
MENRKPPATDAELMRAINKLFDEVEPESPEEIDAILQETGYDPQQVAARMKAVADDALATSLLDWRNRAPKKIQQERAKLDSFVSSASRSRTDMVAAIRKLAAGLGGSQSLVGAYHRNFEEASDEDLASLLAELEYLAAQQHSNLGQD